MWHFYCYNRQSLRFYQHLSTIFKLHLKTFNPDITPKITQYLDFMPICLPEKRITPNEIKSTIQKPYFKKTPGFGPIITEVARGLLKKTIMVLTHLFNAILRLSYFPLLWKISNIVLIPKPKKSLDLLSSYRPISVFSFLAKIMERLI